MSIKGQGSASPRALFASLKSNRNGNDISIVRSSQNVNTWGQVKLPFSLNHPTDYNKKDILQYTDSKNEITSNRNDQSDFNYETSKHVQEKKDPYEYEEKNLSDSSIIEETEFLDVIPEIVIEEEKVQANNNIVERDRGECPDNSLTAHCEKNQLVLEKSFFPEQIHKEYQPLRYSDNISISQSNAKSEENYVSNELTTIGSGIDFSKFENKSIKMLIVEDVQDKDINYQNGNIVSLLPDQRNESQISEIKFPIENTVDLDAQYVTLIENQAIDCFNKSDLEERQKEIRTNSDHTKIEMHTSQLFQKKCDHKNLLIKLINEVESLNEFVLHTAEAIKTQKKTLSERGKVRKNNEI